MIRLMIYAALFGAGVYAGAEYTRFQMVDGCLDAGGRVDSRGFCEGAAPDG